MQLVRLPGIDPANVADALGAATHAKGVRYAQQRAVVRMAWDATETALHGTVRGRLGDFYTTTAYFSSSDGESLRFDLGDCSCPVGFNCKHVAALVLTATSDEGRGALSTPTTRTSTWEQSLGALLEDRSAGDARGSGVTPLAIELTLVADAHRAPGAERSATPPAAVRLVAKLVQPGKKGWVNGGLSWTRLSVLPYHGGYVASQVRLLQELYALYQARSRGVFHSAYGYGYGDEKSIELSSFESRQLWPLLAEAEAAGVQLVHGRKGLGPVGRGTAEFCLDVTNGTSRGASVVSPALRVEGADIDAMPVRFIGSEGHGVVCVDRAEAERSPTYATWRLYLASLDRPVPPRLQRMALESQPLEIPADAGTRFRDEYFPRLRHMARVVSSDGSFTPPAISDPTLVLHAGYGEGHELDLGWEWAYQVGDARLRAPLEPPGPDAGYRDVDAEREIVAGLDIAVDQFGLRPAEPAAADQRPELLRSVELRGTDTMRFTTELLPLLADQPGLAVEVSGEPADYREAGDSLRIGVSTDEVAGEADWFDLGITITVEERQVPFADVFTALCRDEPHLLLSDGAYFSLQKPELQALRRLIEEAQALHDMPADRLSISRFQAGLWDELTQLGVVTRQAEAWQQQVHGLLSLERVDTEAVPAALSARLRPYQTDGYGWLAFLWKHQLGGILADDMGLGKTLQALALVCRAKQSDPALAPFLVVAPTSVVSNWVAESTRFAPELGVVPITDTMKRRGKSLHEVVAGADVVVTSYTLFRLDFDGYAAMPWSGMLLDEAQFTKNHQSKIYQCARRLPAPFKLAVTGTPMENNLMELWSLLSITAPGLFPNPTRFRDYYARPIEKQGDDERLAQLRRRIKPLVKRRTKEQVVTDLPAKQEQVLEVDLHPQHRRIYQRHLQRERQKVLGLLDDMNKNRFTILRSLTLLRQLSLHAGLVDDTHRNLSSSKVDALFEQLRDVVDGGHRALVFSQFTKFLAVVRDRCDADGIPYCYLDGTTRHRAKVLQRFKDDPVPLFLISLKAGGFGLNLTEADYCFLLDPWWNPATEVQAVDRTHRIGQTRNVMVYRLVATDTIEEKVMALKARKAELFANVMDEGGAFSASLDADDIRGLFE